MRYFHSNMRRYRHDNIMTHNPFFASAFLYVRVDPVFFDLETLYLFKDLGTPRGDPSRLRLAIGGVLSGKKISFFTEEDLAGLFDLLDDTKLIVGFNVLEFDYRVLQPYASFNVHARYRDKTLDMFDVLKRMTGVWSGLDRLCELNTGCRKNADTKTIPEMWRDGRREQVRKYLENDLHMTRSLFDHVNNKGKLKYEHKTQHKNYGIKEIRFRWEMPP